MEFRAVYPGCPSAAARVVATLAAVVGALVFLLAFVGYAWTTAPGLTWLDSPEFVGAAASLGIPHSPGHPLAAMFGRISAYLPVGDIAFRVNLLSSLCCAGAAWFLYRALVVVTAGVAPKLNGKVVQSTAALSSLVAASSLAMWQQATRAEVYGLVILFLAAALYFAVSYLEKKRSEDLLCACLVGGLALANHHLMALFFLLPTLGVVLASKELRPRLRLAGIGALFGVLGLFTLAYLPARASAAPLINWGNPDNLSNFLWTISGAAFQSNALTQHSTPASVETTLALVAVFVSATLVLGIASLLGTYLSVRLQRQRRLFILCWAIIAMSIAGRVAVGFDPATPDHQAYLLPAILALILLGSVSLCMLAQLLARWQPRAMWLAPALALTALGIQLFTVPAQADLSEARSADALARLEIDSPPPASVILLSYFQTSFRWQAMTSAENARPDLSVLDRGFLTYPDAVAHAIYRYPSVAELARAGVSANDPPPQRQLEAVAEERPLFVELHLATKPTWSSQLTPSGPFARFQSKNVDLSLTQDHEYAISVQRLLEASAPSDVPGMQAAFLWLEFVRAFHQCRGAHAEKGQQALERALRVAPRDRDLLELAQRCDRRPKLQRAK